MMAMRKLLLLSMLAFMLAAPSRGDGPRSENRNDQRRGADGNEDPTKPVAYEWVNVTMSAAFASMAYLEFYQSGGSTRTRHRSEQFMYWCCKETDGDPSGEGTTLAAARKVLKTRGVCLARTWPYNPLPGPTEGQGPPPAGAVDQAGQSKYAATQPIAPNNLTAIRAVLDSRRPVVLGVKTFPNWDFPSVSDTGEIPMPLPGSRPDGGHAICLVGYETRDGVPGGGAFIFRNSWGASWARPHGRFGDGHGTLFFNYVSQYGMEAYQ